MSNEINVEALDFSTINSTNHAIFYSAGYRKIGALSQFPVYAGRYLYNGTVNTMCTAASYHPFTVAISNARNNNIAGPFSAEVTSYNSVSFYMYTVRYTQVGGLGGESDITLDNIHPPECTGTDFNNNIAVGYLILTGQSPPPEPVAIPITYIPVNSSLSGPESAVSNTVVNVSVSFPDGYIYQETGVQVYNQDGTIPFTYSDGQITFTMP